jgi:uroporphyrin-3 C-methyltransferase
MSDKENQPENESAELANAPESTSAPEPLGNGDSQIDVNSEPDTGLAEQADVDSPEPQVDETPKAGRSVAGVFAFLALLLALVAIAGGGYLYWEMRTLKSSTDGLAAGQQNLIQTLDVRPRLDKLDQRIDVISQQNVKAFGAANERLEELQDSASMLQDSVRALQEVGSRGDRDWVIAETRYLLKMAQHRLALAGDLDSATAAIRAADAQLHTLADVSLLPVREALAKEIASLRSAPKPDIEGVVLALIQLARRSNSLPLKTSRNGSIDVALAPEPLAGATGDTQIDAGLGSEMMKLVRQFVVVKRTALEDSVNLDIDESAAENLGRRAKLQLALQKAQIAALRRDQVDFIAAIGQSRFLLAEHFDEQNDLVRRFAQDLSLVEQSPVRPEVKGVGAALLLLDKIEIESEGES